MGYLNGKLPPNYAGTQEHNKTCIDLLYTCYVTRAAAGAT